MNNITIAARNKLLHFFYTKALKPIYFHLDPEEVHNAMIRIGVSLGRYALTRKITSLLFSFSHPMLEQNILGIHFSNPIGLAAGFDKNALLTDILPSVGFGFAEVGSITGEPCEGNPKPRLWRLPKSKGIIVWYGLKNDGAEIISKKMKKLKFNIPIGISVAKTNSPETVNREKGIKDYLKAVEHFLDIGDYFTINISCPNAYGGEPFCGPLNLEALLSELDKIQIKKPIFIKLPPDLSEKEVDDILEISKKHRVHGFVISNLTKDPSNLKVNKEEFKNVSKGRGGISGKPVEDLSNKLISRIYQKEGDKFIIIGVGGIFSAEDAYKKIKLGASLTQLITGVIFEGPQLVSEINRGLVRLLKSDGFQNISEARGTEKL